MCNSANVNGASITYDIGPLKHIWTYATGLSLQYDLDPNRLCPCNTGNTVQVPSFVGSDYYCETGNNAAGLPTPGHFFPNDTLWDGQQCVGVEAPCCTHPNMPWFIKTLGEITTEDIQLRLCTDNEVSNEGTLLQLISLYVH